MTAISIPIHDRLTLGDVRDAVARAMTGFITRPRHLVLTPGQWNDLRLDIAQHPRQFANHRIDREPPVIYGMEVVVPQEVRVGHRVFDIAHEAAGRLERQAQEVFDNARDLVREDRIDGVFDEDGFPTRGRTTLLDAMRYFGAAEPVAPNSHTNWKV